MPSHTYVNDFESSQYVEGTYCVQNVQRGLTRNGKPFLKALVSDKTGQIPARLWNLEDALFDSLPTNGFVWLAGHTQPYNDQIQLIIQDIRPTEVDEAGLADLLPTTEKNIDEMFESLTGVLDSLVHPGMKALARAYVEDEALMRLFRHAPAGVSLHHAYLGGLLEHTLQLLQMAEVLLPFYPHLSRDIVLMGLFLHDLAKTRELRFDSAFSYTDEGHLLGHLVMGSLWLQRKSDQAKVKYGETVPRDALLVLHHIIISHHAEPEFGAARIPSTPEAIFIAHLDNLDAKTHMAMQGAARDDESMQGQNGEEPPRFTEKMWALSTRIFRPDPLAD